MILADLTTMPTTRQREILQGVADDLSEKEIAQRLGISIFTVKTHLENARERLGVHGRAALVAAALRKGWIH